MELKDEILISMEYGYSKQEIFDTLLRKGFPENDIITELDSLYPSLKPIDKRSGKFLFPAAGTLLFSLSFIVGYFTLEEFQYIMYTAGLLFLWVELYRMKNYALLTWIILLGVIDFILFILVIAFLLGTELNSVYSEVVVFIVFLFISILLYYIWDIKRNQKKYLRSVMRKAYISFSRSY